MADRTDHTAEAATFIEVAAGIMDETDRDPTRHIALAQAHALVGIGQALDAIHDQLDSIRRR